MKRIMDDDEIRLIRKCYAEANADYIAEQMAIAISYIKENTQKEQEKAEESTE